ncbi:MAG TPA: 30S ribosomal protein S9 [Candidatus Acidoferrales bacterium]|nr:30S ribosomal protein S9 [Candidatus Acidoferrales bacterium]
MPDNIIRGLGRRKTAVARVRLLPGEGRVLINEKSPLAYLGQRTLEMEVLHPLRVTDCLRRFDVSVRVKGGGVSGQAGAIAHGLARALETFDPELRPVLKKSGLLTRDSREKERKKYGLKRARKAPQYTKR